MSEVLRKKAPKATKTAKAPSVEVPKVDPDAQVFTYADFDQGVQKQWPVEAIGGECVLFIQHVQALQDELNKFQSEMNQLQLKMNDKNSALKDNRERIRGLLPGDNLAVVTALERREETSH